MRLVGQHICQAFVAYDDGDYAKAADLLYDIRYEVIKIGGSHAQVCRSTWFQVSVNLLRMFAFERFTTECSLSTYGTFNIYNMHNIVGELAPFDNFNIVLWLLTELPLFFMHICGM